MLKFFGKIREGLLTENPFSKYLLIAIGEIVLVVIGILIALQVNNWNEQRANNNLARNYIENIKEELNAQIELLNTEYIDRFDRKITGLKSAKTYFENPHEIKDTLAFLNEISYGAVGSYGIENASQDVFESLISTIVIDSIETNLRNEILAHYSYANHMADVSQTQASSYQEAVNGLRPFDPSAPKQMSKTDQLRFIKALKTEEFIRQVNIEISNGLYSNDSIKKILDSAKKLIRSIDTYLATD